MSIDSFAAVLAVHPGTVRRWEGIGDGLVAVDGIAANVLAAAQQRLHGPSRPTPQEVRRTGDQVAETLVAAGTLIALAALIHWLTDRR